MRNRYTVVLIACKQDMLITNGTPTQRLACYSIFLWLLSDLLGSLMRLLYLKPRSGPSSAFLMNIFFALKESKLFFIFIC